MLGSRGSGKTALFKLVNDPRIAPRLRGFFQSEHIPAEALWLDAFSTSSLDPAIRRRYIRTLLALWLSLLSRYQRLRGKVFLRDDLFDAGELGFADATKLRGYAETLSWDHAALLRVAVRHLASGSEAVRAWLREVPGLELHDRGDLGWMPGEMREAVQHAFIGRFAGKVIGRGEGPGNREE